MVLVLEAAVMAWPLVGVSLTAIVVDVDVDGVDREVEVKDFWERKGEIGVLAM